ncbi:ORF1a [Morelia viridis nidovirus 2]|nr:ORF1a [Morelia viridis nidovirus 2]
MVLIVPLSRTNRPPITKPRHYNALPNYYTKYGSDMIKRNIYYNSVDVTPNPLTKVANGNYMEGETTQTKQKQPKKVKFNEYIKIRTYAAATANVLSNAEEIGKEANAPQLNAEAKTDASNAETTSNTEAKANAVKTTKEANAPQQYAEAKTDASNAETTSNAAAKASAVTNDTNKTSAVTPSASYAAVVAFGLNAETTSNIEATTSTQQQQKISRDSAATATEKNESMAAIFAASGAITRIRNPAKNNSYNSSNINTKFLCQATNDPITTTKVHGFIQPHDFSYNDNFDSVIVTNHQLQHECDKVSPSNNQCINTARELVLAAICNAITQEEYNILKFTEVTNFSGLKGTLPRGYTFNATQHINNFTIAIWKHHELPVTHVAVINTDEVSTVIYETRDNEVDLSHFNTPRLYELVRVNTEPADKVAKITNESVTYNNLFYCSEDLPKDYIFIPSFTTKANIKVKPKSQTLDINSKYQQFKDELHDLARTTPFNPPPQQQTPIYSQLAGDHRYFNGEFVISGIGRQTANTITNVTTEENNKVFKNRITASSTYLQAREIKKNFQAQRKVETVITKGTNIWSPLKPSHTVRLGHVCNKKHNLKCKKEIEKILCNMCKQQWYGQKTGGVYDTEIDQTIVHTQMCVACAIELVDYNCDCDGSVEKIVPFKNKSLTPQQMKQYLGNKNIQFGKIKSVSKEFENIQEKKLKGEFFHHTHFALRNANKVTKLSKFCFVKVFDKWWDLPAFGNPKQQQQQKPTQQQQQQAQSQSQKQKEEQQAQSQLKQQQQQQQHQQQKKDAAPGQQQRQQQQQQQQQQAQSQPQKQKEEQQAQSQPKQRQQQQQHQQQKKDAAPGQQQRQQQQQQQQQQAQSQPQKQKEEQQAQSQPKQRQQQQQHQQQKKDAAPGQQQRQQQQQQQQQQAQSQPQKQKEEQQAQSQPKQRQQQQQHQQQKKDAAPGQQQRQQQQQQQQQQAQSQPQKQKEEQQAQSQPKQRQQQQQQQQQHQQQQHQKQPQQMTQEESVNYINDLVHSQWFTTVTNEMNRHYKKNAICRHNLYGKCRFGSKCKMAHISLNGKYGPLPNQEQQEQIKATTVLPCRNYLQGCCSFGDKCNNLHNYINIQRVNEELNKGNLFLLVVPKGFKTKYVIVSEQQMQIQQQLQQLQAVSDSKQEKQQQQQEKQEIQQEQEGQQQNQQQQIQQEQEGQQQNQQQQIQQKQEGQQQDQQQENQQMHDQKKQDQQKQEDQQKLESSLEPENQQQQQLQQSLEQQLQKLQLQKDFQTKVKQQQQEIQKKKDQKKQERRQLREKVYQQEKLSANQQQQVQQENNKSIAVQQQALDITTSKPQRPKYQTKVINLTQGTPLNLSKPDSECNTCQDAVKYLVKQGLKRVATVFDKNNKQLNKFAIVVALKSHYGIFESGNSHELYNGDVYNEILSSSVEAVFVPTSPIIQHESDHRQGEQQQKEQSDNQQQQCQQQQPESSTQRQQLQQQHEEPTQCQQSQQLSDLPQDSPQHQQQHSASSPQHRQQQSVNLPQLQATPSSNTSRKSRFEITAVKEASGSVASTTTTSSLSTSEISNEETTTTNNIEHAVRYQNFVSDFRKAQANSKYLPPQFCGNLVQYNKHNFDILYASRFVEMEPMPTKRYHSDNFTFCKEEAGVLYGYYHSDISEAVYEGVDFPCFVHREALLAADCYVSKRNASIYHKNDICTSSANLPLQFETEKHIWTVSRCRAEGIKIDKKIPLNTKVIVCYRYCQLVEGKDTFQRHVTNLLNQHSIQVGDDVTATTDPLRIARSQASLLLKLMEQHLRHGICMSIDNYLNCQSTEFSLTFNNFNFTITKFVLARYQLCPNGNEIEPDLHGIFIKQLCSQVNFKYTIPEELTPSNYGKVIINIIKQNTVCIDVKIPYEFEAPDSLDVQPQVDDIDYKKLIGRGAYGRVFGSVSGKYVFKLQGLQGSQYEHKILNQVKHLNVPQVVQHYEFPEQQVGIIKMKALGLRTLDLLKVEEKQDLKTRQDMLMQCLDHFEDVLKCGIIQNDYHMANIAWTDEGDFVVLDWGIAKQRKEGQEAEFKAIAYGWYVSLIVDVLANTFLDYHDEVYYVVKEKDLLCYYEWFMDEELFTKTHQIFGDKYHETLHHPPIQEEEEEGESEWESDYSEDQDHEDQQEKPQEKLQEVKPQEEPQQKEEEKLQEVEPQQRSLQQEPQQQLQHQQVDQQQKEEEKPQEPLQEPLQQLQHQQVDQQQKEEEKSQEPQQELLQEPQQEPLQQMQHQQVDQQQKEEEKQQGPQEKLQEVKPQEEPQQKEEEKLQEVEPQQRSLQQKPQQQLQQQQDKLLNGKVQGEKPDQQLQHQQGKSPSNYTNTSSLTTLTTNKLNCVNNEINSIQQQLARLKKGKAKAQKAALKAKLEKLNRKKTEFELLNCKPKTSNQHEKTGQQSESNSNSQPEQGTKDASPATSLDNIPNIYDAMTKAERKAVDWFEMTTSPSVSTTSLTASTSSYTTEAIGRPTSIPHESSATIDQQESTSVNSTTSSYRHNTDEQVSIRVKPITVSNNGQGKIAIMSSKKDNIEFRLNEVKKMLNSLQQVNTNLLNEDQTLCHNEALRLCIEQIHTLATEVNDQSVSSSERSDNAQQTPHSRDIQAASREKRPKVDKLREVSDITISTSTTATSCKPGVNRCFIYAAEAALMTIGKYFTQETLNDLYKLADKGQHDASEVVARSGIPTIQTAKCILHGTCELTSPCCSNVVPNTTATHILIKQHLGEASSYGLVVMQPLAYLHYTGTALNGHWKCSYNTPQGTRKMKDSGVTSNINKHPKATWTLCKVMLNTNLELANGDIVGKTNITIISQNINLVASLLTAHGDPVHHDATTLAIVRGNDAITVVTPEAVDYKTLTPQSTVYCLEYDPVVSKKLHATKCRLREPQPPASSFTLDSKNKDANIKAMQRNLRQQLTKYYSTNLTTQGPIKTLVVGIGKGNDIPHYAAANNGNGIVYDGCDISNEALNICATKVPSTTMLYQSDVNTKQFDKLRKNYDLLVSTFSWHFKDQVKCGKHHEFHVMPIYNPDTYDTWSKYYDVTVHAKDEVSITHTINMPTCRTTETLHTTKWWYGQYCSNVTIKSLQTELNSTNKHFSNFIVLIHTGHKTSSVSTTKTASTKSTPVSRGSLSSHSRHNSTNSNCTETASSANSTSQSTTTTQATRNQDVKVPQLPADNHDCNTMHPEDADDEKTEFEQCLNKSNIPITIHSCNSEDFTDTAYATRPENVNAFFCREFCTNCFVHLPKNAVVDRQLLTNAQVYLKWSGISINELNYNLISTLHQRQVICLDHLEPAPAATDDNWVIRRTTTKPVKVLYMSHDVFKTIDSTQAAIFHRDFDIFTHQLSRFTKRPVQSVVIHTSSKDEAEAVCNTLEHYNITNIKIAEHRVGKFETLAFDRKTCQYETLHISKKRTGIWDQIKQHFYDIKKPYLIEWNNITEECSHDDKYKAIASFSDKHGLDSHQRLIGSDKCVFVDYKTGIDTNPDKLDDYYRSRHATETGKEVVYTAVFKLPPTDSNDSRTVFAALAVTKDGKSLYINGDKTSIPATAVNKALYHIMQAKYGNNTKVIGEVYSKFFSPEKETTAAYSYKDLLTVLPFMLFLLQPGFFTLTLSLLVMAYFLFDRKALYNSITSTHQLATTAIEYETASAMSYLRLGNYKVTKYTIATANVFICLYLLLCAYWACVSNHDLIDTTQAPYHSYAQRILAFFDYIPSVHDYASAITLKELCGSNIICRLGSPYNKLYLDQYKHYVTTKSYVFRDKLLSLCSFYTPWGLLMCCLDFKPSWHLACYNILMTIFSCYFIFRRFFTCCKASGPFCAKHAMLRTNNIQYYCSGKPYNIQAIKVKYCTKHKWWCNTTQEHLLPHPIARVIEASTQMKSNYINSDNYFKYVSQPADRELPEAFKDYNHNNVYSTNNLSYLEWTQRAALFAHCSSTKVKISSHDASSITNQKVEMTQAMLDYFKTSEDWRYNYVAAQQAGRKNVLHVGFLENMSEKELSEFYEFCCQYDQSFTKTCIKRDNFLNGKVPDCFKSSRLLSTKYHTDTIYLDSFAVEHHDDIKQQASLNHFLVSQGKPKKYINSKRNIFTALAILVLLALTRVAYRKVVKINTPAGLNPTGKDYAKGTLYLHDSIIATPVAYGNNRRVQAWHFNNGTFAFTEKRSTLTARTSCGDFDNSFLQVETYHQTCDQYWPLAINLFKLSIYWFQADKPYTTRHGDYFSQDGAICFGLSDSLVCHETMSIYTPTAFIWITSSVVFCFIFSIFCYIKIRGYFGNYTSSVLVLMTIHAITVVLYLFMPGLAFVFVIALFFFPAYRFVIGTYSFVVCSMFFGLNLVILFGLYVIVFLVIFWFSRQRTTDVDYTPSGVVFSSNFSGIAKNAFLLTPENVPTILSVTGKNYAHLLEMSTGPQLKPETALANAILKCSITNTKMLYEPPKSTRLPVYLQSKLNRLGDIVINNAQLTNICGIYDGTGVIGHGIFTTPTTVLTARHCYTPTIQVFYRGTLLSVKDHNDVGFNTILTVDKQIDIKPLAIDNHHELELGTQYTHVVSPLDDQATVTVHQLYPTPSGHFAHALTIAGESGSPIFYHNKLVGIHQAMVKSKEHTGAHAIACRVDGTPFDSSFHDTLMAAGKVQFDGNALLNHYLTNECRKVIPVREFNNQIVEANKLIGNYNHISIINDHALLQAEPRDLTPLIDFLKGSPVIRDYHCKPYKIGNDIKLQNKFSHRLIVYCTLSNMLSLAMTVTYFLTTAIYGTLTIKNFIDLLLAGAMLTVVFRSRHVVFLLTTGAYFVNVIELFMHVCHTNIEVIRNIFSSNDEIYAHVVQTVVRFGIQDIMLCTVILFVMLLKFILLPLRCIIFTIVYWTLVYFFGVINFYTVAVFIFSFANTSSWFTCLTLLLQNTIYFPIWFTLNIVLSLRIGYPKWLVNRYHQITSDSVRVNRSFFCHHLAVYHKPPSFLEVLISQMFYSQEDVIEYVPQSKIVPYVVVGSATHYPNVNAKSRALMSGSDSDALYAHFISAVEAVLQSTTAADQQVFMTWCAATCDQETLEKWLEDNPEDTSNKLRTKRRNIIQARIMFLKAKEEKLRKQINLMQLEQVRGMMRSELSIKLCDVLNRSVAEMQEKANMRTKTFGKGIIAASTLTVPEILVVTNTNGRDKISWDDESECFCFEFEEAIYHIAELNTNTGQAIHTEAELNALTATNFPLYGKLQDFTFDGVVNQANIGYSIKPHQIRIIRSSSGIKIEYASSSDKAAKPILEEVQEATDNTVLLLADGVLKPFKVNSHVQAPILAAVMAKLRFDATELQSIRLGGLENSTEHVATSNQPLRCRGYTTYFAPSLCRFCRMGVEHKCKYQQFVQIPANEEPDQYLSSHDICQHNKFICNSCHNTASNQHRSTTVKPAEKLRRLREQAKNSSRPQ